MARVDASPGSSGLLKKKREDVSAISYGRRKTPRSSSYSQGHSRPFPKSYQSCYMQSSHPNNQNTTSVHPNFQAPIYQSPPLNYQSSSPVYPNYPPPYQIPSPYQVIAPNCANVQSNCQAPPLVYQLQVPLVGHDTEDCINLKHKIQDLINQEVISLEPAAPNVNTSPLPNHGGGNVNMIETDEDWAIAFLSIKEKREFVILTPAKVVALVHSETLVKPKFVIETAVSQGMTRSGRCYTPNELDLRGQEKHQAKRPISKGEAEELWRRKKPKYYSIVKNLEKTLAQISIWALLMSSQSHRQALMKALDDTYVPMATSSDNVAAMFFQVIRGYRIKFCDDELPLEGRSHNNALHITLRFDLGKLEQNQVNVRDFDGVKRDTLGAVNLTIQTCPEEISAQFQVFDIDTSYNLLLGGPSSICLDPSPLLSIDDEARVAEQRAGYSWRGESLWQTVLVKGSRYGLGYIPTDDDMKVKKKNDRALTKQIPHLYQYFPIWEYAEHEDLREGICDLFEEIDAVIEEEVKLAGICDAEPRESFADCYVGYHQILMDVEDVEKTAFITPWGVYHYRVMPFGLKNAGATCMRAMRTIFHDMIHKEIEVYVDDVIFKARESLDHLTHLRKFFDHLHCYNLTLNPAKCAFGVPSGKLLGFIVSRRGIEMYPSKIKAIQELPSSKKRKETKECQTAFDAIKNYLSIPPVLVPPREGSTLLLYLFVSDNAFECVLGQHDEKRKKEKAIYYISKKFTPYESHYTLLERTCCALMWIAQKLRHYLSSYTTYLISRMYPLKYIFQKAMPTEKLAKWKMLLSEFDIVYVTQKAIKGHTLADHLAENSVDEKYEPLKTYFHDEEVSFVGEDISEAYPGWRLFFDGAANHQDKGIGAVLVSESGQHYPMAAKLRFNCKNNMAEYEPCILGLKNGHRHECNELDDAIATIALMIKDQDTDYIDPLDVELKEHPVHCSHVEAEPAGLPWYFDIKRYLESGTYREDATSNQKKSIRHMALNFF
ncbi:uncharacterized protein [Solanum lycopersicum]|uniref:uncharacterized protein n=1 Tax=Solanum lycopersicum TaxID=4081 RepID=UPI003749D0C7